MPDSPKIIRYSKYPFPKRKYIPGKSIHPRKAPDLYPIPELPQCILTNANDNWLKCERYLYAIDLFNFGYWWEAHEVLEGVWMQSGRKTELALFIQGIIQISAALLKDSQGNGRGAILLSTKGLAKLKRQSAFFLGVEVDRFIKDIESYFSGVTPVLPRILLQNSDVS